jgi:hypothetical protein
LVASTSRGFDSSAIFVGSRRLTKEGVSNELHRSREVEVTRLATLNSDHGGVA